MLTSVMYSKGLVLSVLYYTTFCIFQLTAQANAHQEALQRQLAIERDRIAAQTPGGHLPH